MAGVSISSRTGVEPNIRISSGPKFPSNTKILIRVRASAGIPVMIRDGVRVLIGIRVNIRIPVRIRVRIRILVRDRTGVILVRIRSGIGVPVRIRTTTKTLVKIRTIVRILSTVGILSCTRLLPGVRVSDRRGSGASPTPAVPPPAGAWPRIPEDITPRCSLMV